MRRNVDAVGSGVTQVRVGDRIAIEPAMTCGECDQCLAGRENTCRHNRFLGCPGQAEGSLSQYLVMPEENCFKISDDMSLGEATVSEPLAIAIYAVRQAKLAAEARVGILGMGPIGRTVHLAASDAGCGPVYATDLIAERCSAARDAGCNWVGSPRDEKASRQFSSASRSGSTSFSSVVGSRRHSTTQWNSCDRVGRS